VVCGCCVDYASFRVFLPCQNAAHAKLDRQKSLRLYNISCAICLESATSNRVYLFCGKWKAKFAAPADRLGHVYCRTCILRWSRLKLRRRNNNIVCPTCRDRRTKLCNIAAPEHVINPTARFVEIEISLAGKRVLC
jgi:hypothetical protein